MYMKKVALVLLLSFSVNCFSQETKEEFMASFNKFIELTDGFNKIPDNLIKKHLGKEWISLNDAYRSFYGTFDYKPFNIKENTFTVISITIGGVCSREVLLSFNGEGKLISHIDIGYGCDDPGDFWESSGKSCYLLTKELIVINDYKTIREMDDKGYVKEDSEETNYDKYSFYTITDNGSFKLLQKTGYIITDIDNPSTSVILLTDWKIKNYTLKDLRILRNEIFARKGFIFKSKDLKEHFSQFPWYKPKYTDVTDSLSMIEKANIQIILSVEKEKKEKIRTQRSRAQNVLNGFFIRLKKEEIISMIGSNKISDTTYKAPEDCKNIGIIGLNGLFLIQAEISMQKLLGTYSNYFIYDSMPIYVLNEKDTLNTPAGINPTLVEKTIVISPYEAALKYGHKYNGGIIKFFTK